MSDSTSNTSFYELLDAEDLSVAKLDSFAQNYTRDADRLRRRTNNKACRDAYVGFQSFNWDRINGRLDRIKTEDHERSPKNRRSGHNIVTNNQIMPIIDQLTSHVTASEPIMQAVANRGGADTERAVRIAESEFERLAVENEISRKFRWVVKRGFVERKAYARVDWDDEYGDSYEVWRDPRSGEELVDEAEIENMLTWAASNNVEVEPEIEHVGKISVEVVKDDEVYLIGAENVADACGALQVKRYAYDEIADRFGISAQDVEKNADGGVDDTAEARKSKDSMCTVFELWAPPTATRPDGLYVAWLKGGKKLSEGEYPRGDGMLPYAEYMPDDDFVDEWMSLVAQLIPLQKELNAIFVGLSRHRQLTLNPQLFVPYGAIEKNYTNEGGLLVTYKLMPGMGDRGGIFWRDIPGVPGVILETAREIVGAMKFIAGLTEISGGSIPDQVSQMNSGEVVAQLTEESNKRLNAYYDASERFMNQLGKLHLGLIQERYDEAMLTEIAGRDGRIGAENFQNADLDGITDIKVKTGSLKAKSKVAQDQNLMIAFKEGLTTGEALLRGLDTGQDDRLLRKYDLQRDYTQRQLDRIRSGKPPLDTTTVEIHATALEVIQEFMLSPAAEALDEKTYNDVHEFYKGHEQMLQAEQPMSLPEGVRMNLQVRGEATPAITAAMAQEVGIEIDPEETVQEQQRKLAFEKRAEAIASHGLAMGDEEGDDDGEA